MATREFVSVIDRLGMRCRLAARDSVCRHQSAWSRGFEGVAKRRTQSRPSNLSSVRSPLAPLLRLWTPLSPSFSVRYSVFHMCVGDGLQPVARPA